MTNRRRFLATAAVAPAYLAGCAPPTVPTSDAGAPSCPTPLEPAPLALDFPPPSYFEQLSSDLDAASIGTPVVLIDLDRMEANVDAISDAIAPSRFRIVEKSLPSLDLLRRVLERSEARGTPTGFLVLHLPFLSDLLAAFPGADVLMGKVHLVSAVRRFFRALDAAAQMDAAARVTFLAASAADCDGFAAIATELGVRLRIAIEVDVGLRRSGVGDPSGLPPLLDRLRAAPSLELRGLLGYDGHVAYGPRNNLRGLMSAHADAMDELQSFIDALEAMAPELVPDDAIVHSGGTATYPLYGGTPVNDVATGGGVLRPGEYPDHVISALLPAIFVATPVLAQYDDPGLPFVGRSGIPSLAGLQGLTIYGGGWPSLWVHPEGIAGVSLVSDPGAAPPLVPNQGLVTAPDGLDLGVGDWIYYHPRGSDVLFQFEEVLCVRGRRLTGERLAPFPRRY